MAKGLEFRAVAVMARHDEIIPSQECIENVADDADLEESGQHPNFSRSAELTWGSILKFRVYLCWCEGVDLVGALGEDADGNE